MSYTVSDRTLSETAHLPSRTLAWWPRPGPRPGRPRLPSVNRTSLAPFICLSSGSWPREVLGAAPRHTKPLSS